MAEDHILRIKGLSDKQLRQLAQKPTDTVYVKAAAPWTRFGSYTPEVTEKGLAARQLSRRAAIQKSNAADKAAFHKKMVQMTKLSLQAPLRAELQTSKAELQTRKAELQTSKTEIARLKRELKTAGEEFVETEVRMNTALAAHERTIAGLKMEKQGNLKQNIETVAKLEETIKENLGVIEKLVKKQHTLSLIESSTKKQAQNQKKLSTELSQARTLLADKEAALENVLFLHAEEIAKLRNSDAQSAAKLEQQIQVITELNSYKEEQAHIILGLKSELTALKQPFMDESSLGLGEAPKQQQQQSTKISALREKIAELNGQHEEDIEHMSGTIRELQAQLQRQKNRKEKQVVQQQPAGSHYQENIRQLTSKNKDLNTENNDLRQELSTLEQHRANYQLEKKGNQSQKTKLKTEALAYEAEIQTLNELLEEEHVKNKTCESNLLIRTSSFEKLMAENIKNKSLLNDYEQEFEEHLGTIQQLKQQLNQFQTEHEEMLHNHAEQKDRLQSQLKRERQQKQQLNDAYMRRQ
jgi:hypothetical protein